MIDRTLAAALAAAACALALPAAAQGGPEQLDQLEPGAGEWQLEYAGSFGGEGEQEIEALVALSDRVAIGAEVEFEGPRGGLRLEGVGIKALYRAIDPGEAPVGLGMQLQLGIGADGSFAGAEGRVIVEAKRGGWWMQGDAILRHAREDGDRGTGIAYGASLQRTIGDDIWFGAEASGQLARLSGAAGLAPRGQHYAGPSLTFEQELGGEDSGEVEIGLAWLQRLRGNGPGSGPRIFAQFTF